MLSFFHWVSKSVYSSMSILICRFVPLDPKTVLIVDLIPWIFGSIKGCFMAMNTYIVLTTPPDRRIIKFSTCDVAAFIGELLHLFLGKT